MSTTKLNAPLDLGSRPADEGGQQSNLSYMYSFALKMSNYIPTRDNHMPRTVLFYFFRKFQSNFWPMWLEFSVAVARIWMFCMFALKNMQNILIPVLQLQAETVPIDFFWHVIGIFACRCRNQNVLHVTFAPEEHANLNILIPALQLQAKTVRSNHTCQKMPPSFTQK